MDKLLSEKVSKELTFHSCLLQVVQNRTENLSDIPKLYVREIKRTGNKFKEAIDNRLSEIYKPLNSEEVDQGMDLINFLTDKLEEAWKFYEEKAKRNEL
jgi:hypothetical protein